jgi:alkylation response protein AidB-like acyl-CoA dehydrogenase
MGLRASKTCMVSLEGARVPKDALVGDEGAGFRIALATLDHSRLGIAAQAVGIAQAAMDEALRYGRDREQFGKPIIHHQAIAFRLAEMDTELAAARALLYQAAWASVQPGRHSRQSARAKLYASEMCNRVVEWAVQVHGGYGYSREYTVERLYRDARVTTIYEGSSEVQKMVIARHLQDVAENL